MNKERLAWTVSLVLIALLAFQIPGSLAQRDDDYAFVRRLIDIHRQVATNYVENVDEARLHDGAIKGMLEELDPFSMYIPPSRQEDFDRLLEGSFKGVGVVLNQNPDGRIEVVTPIDDSPAAKAGVMAGDVLVKVNGESLDNMRLPEVVKKVAGPLGSEVKLSFKRVTGEDLELTIKRQEIILRTVKGYSRKPDNSWDYWASEDPKIAYVRITQFTSDTYANLKPVLENLLADGMRGLILDLRFNPGGQLKQAVDIVDMFVEKGTIVSVKGRNRPERIESATGSATMTKFPMVVLVNEASASASEIVAGSLKDNGRAVVIGERSYGKGSVQELIPLDSKGGELKLTVAYYYLPSGRCVHRQKDATEWGVEPQIVVPMEPAAEQKMYVARQEQENFRRPVIKGATRPTTDSSPVSLETLDPQLHTALNTLIGGIVFQGGAVVAPATKPTKTADTDGQPSPSKPAPDTRDTPSTEPTDQPATAPGVLPNTTTPVPATGPAETPTKTPPTDTGPDAKPNSPGEAPNTTAPAVDPAKTPNATPATAPARQP